MAVSLPSASAAVLLLVVSSFDLIKSSFRPPEMDTVSDFEVVSLGVTTSLVDVVFLSVLLEEVSVDFVEEVL